MKRILAICTLCLITGLVGCTQQRMANQAKKRLVNYHNSVQKIHRHCTDTSKTFRDLEVCIVVLKYQLPKEIQLAGDYSEALGKVFQKNDELNLKQNVHLYGINRIMKNDYQLIDTINTMMLDPDNIRKFNPCPQQINKQDDLFANYFKRDYK